MCIRQDSGLGVLLLQRDLAAPAYVTLKWPSSKEVLFRWVQTSRLKSTEDHLDHFQDLFAGILFQTPNLVQKFCRFQRFMPLFRFRALVSNLRDGAKGWYQVSRHGSQEDSSSYSSAVVYLHVPILIHILGEFLGGICQLHILDWNNLFPRPSIRALTKHEVAA